MRLKHNLKVFIIPHLLMYQGETLQLPAKLQIWPTADCHLPGLSSNVAAANPAATIAAWLLQPLLTALHCTC
jgi:hypothetical protein